MIFNCHDFQQSDVTISPWGLQFPQFRLENKWCWAIVLLIHMKGQLTAIMCVLLIEIFFLWLSASVFVATKYSTKYTYNITKIKCCSHCSSFCKEKWQISVCKGVVYILVLVITLEWYRRNPRKFSSGNMVFNLKFSFLSKNLPELSLYHFLSRE